VNALGVVDQTRAANELAAHGAPAALVPTLIMAGRALQLVAGIALVIGWHERLAAQGAPRLHRARGGLLALNRRAHIVVKPRG
jgi:hypothetical protein